MKCMRLLTVVAIVALVLAACARPTPEVVEVTREVEKVVTQVVKETVKETVVVAGTPKVVEKEVTKIVTPTPAPLTFKEVPMLAELVKKGDLPPIDQRLPINPRVLNPFEETGTYGGEIKWGFVGDPVWGGGWIQVTWENLMAWNPDYSGYEPNILERLDTSSDAKEYTLHLRKGMKWSDGDLFDADDILFYLQDVVFNTDLTPTTPAAWKDVKAVKLDDYTVKITFPKANGLWGIQQNTYGGRIWAAYPKHYCQQFHLNYNSKVDELVKAQGDANITDWIALFKRKCGDNTAWLTDVEKPTLFAWVVRQPQGTGTQAIFERNPYYWKVDDQGNQLPYIDRVIVVSYQDVQSRVLAMLNGDIDAMPNLPQENRPLFYEARDQGKPVKIMTVLRDSSGQGAVYINWTTRNQAVADAFSNKDFRIGLSYAINRPQLSEIISDGRGEPAQCSPPPGSPLYDERLATQYTEFDQAKANEYLDKVFPQKDAEGFRLGPDGKRFSFVLTVVSDTGWAPYFAVEGELVAQYWRDVGIDVKLDVVPAAVSGQRVNDNSIEAYIFSTEGGRGLNALFDQRCYVPGNSNAFWGNAWRIWRNDPNNEFAQEPPQWAQEAWARWEAVVQAPTLDQQIKLMKEGVFKDAADNLYLIGLVRAPEEIEVIHARLGNTPDEFFYGFPSGAYHITSPEQWYVKE